MQLSALFVNGYSMFLVVFVRCRGSSKLEWLVLLKAPTRADGSIQTRLMSLIIALQITAAHKHIYIVKSKDSKLEDRAGHPFDDQSQSCLPFIFLRLCHICSLVSLLC
ncbi:hypothetical protein BKA67DRAFT_47952 [Truncatella angustata]|uniref:Uncharacterized protein n=1 Tax=Truncatella angustata TaxID=152316 RepID=A0A9P8UY84_9PEZI|nr:uncharacterized protein BKA67DRAFT_47952 [Truncatella angustata]KAH6660330.1 hypothetical protein BKA67DRAFT_47952 [Truncatella angustata]